MVLPSVAVDGEPEIAEETLLDSFFDEDLMSVEKICFAFPFLECILRDSSQSPALRLNAIQLLSSAFNTHFIKVSALSDLIS